ncbi:453d12ef-e1fa-4cca-80c3-1f4c6813acf8 [Sclerotinia trifoliorum]|uniref:453d12ef-e1fa-4cca-80c3-1f4c6813acf8 n=1 Tax=Sclerotinia trifoliorum TaxID=28548 RepID=A0A8H2VW79_9HELO|nr:453d12ef-e1fa-4cca-80c3-1f4c6813acf8 [Sclerotinia trifoliorum]
MGVLPIDTREALHLNELHSRATCFRRGYGYYRCNSAWYRFGRWVLAGILIFIGLILLFAIMCITRRRRRRNQIRSGNTPMTYNQPNTYNSQQQQYAPPAGAPPHHGGGNQDYYGASGVTQPQNAYAK